MGIKQLLPYLNEKLKRNVVEMVPPKKDVSVVIKHATRRAVSLSRAISREKPCKAGREVANYLGAVHYEFHFTSQDGIDAIEEH